jgi:hypothetical protein
MNLQLEQAIESVKTELTVREDGIGYSSIRGAARLSGIDESTLREVFQGAGKKPHKLAQMLTEKGFNLRGFFEGVQDLALQVILKYYAYKAGARCTELAELCLDAFAAMGIRVWLQNITGWKSDIEIRSKALTIADEAVTMLKDIQVSHPATYQMVIQALEIPQKSDSSLELANTSSLVVNRLGLAFNKQLKAFELLQDSTSPEAFISLKQQYQELAEQHAELLKLKTPNVDVGQGGATYKQLAELQIKIQRLETINDLKDARIVFLEAHIDSLEWSIEFITNLKKSLPSLDNN